MFVGLSLQSGSTILMLTKGILTAVPSSPEEVDEMIRHFLRLIASLGLAFLFPFNIDLHRDDFNNCTLLDCV